MTGALATAALELAEGGWEVFPLAPRSKVPLIAKRDGGQGVLDATCDLEQVERWWHQWPNANIGARVPLGVLVVDVDPRNRGAETWAELAADHEPIVTLTSLSGRGDGGAHRYFLDPAKSKPAGRLGDGVDVKSRGGYLVVPPSIHPDTGRAYSWVDPVAPIAAMPRWLATLVRPPVIERPRAIGPRIVSTSTSEPSVADAFTASTRWAEILGPEGWRLVKGDGDEDGSRWRHPNASNAFSATIKYGLLFVYSTGTPFEVTCDGTARGYTRFRAFAVLHHRGDLSAAARALRGAA
jgi:hypothetical protein